MTIKEAAREELAKFGLNLSDEQLEDVIWTFTGFPCFWCIPGDGATPEECFRKQIREWAQDPEAAERELDAEMTSEVTL
jgi:hypothetical protein